MPERAFVVQCPKCEEYTAAYDPQRSAVSDIGEAVRQANQDGKQIALVESPVTLNLGGCRCVREDN